MALSAALMKAPSAKARAAPRQTVQAKLEVGPADDHFEREADSVAASVMSASAAPVTIPPTITPIGAQRKLAPAAKEEEKEKGAAASIVAQRKAAAGGGRDEEEKAPGNGGRVQREAAAGAAGGTASAAVDSAIQAMRSGPAPGLDGSTRAFMEGRFGRDFGAVRVHHDSRAAEAAGAIGARAFTIGNDIFFKRGEYRPNSRSGRRLIAHELTHAVQQQGAAGTAARARIQRSEETPPATKEAVPENQELNFTLDNGGPESNGMLKLSSPQRIEYPYLNLPMLNGTLKGTSSDLMKPASVSGTLPKLNTPYTVDRPTPPGSYKPANVWLAGARRSWSGAGKSMAAKLQQKITPPPSAPATPPVTVPMKLTSGAYVLGFANPGSDVQRRTMLFGTVEELSSAQLVLAPRWVSAEGSGAASFEADHILELQLGGADRFDNMWQLEAEYNGTIGPKIKNQIVMDAGEALASVRERYELGSLTLPTIDTVAGWPKVFRNLRQGPGMGRTDRFWTRKQIEDGEQLLPLKFLSSEELRDRNFNPLQEAGTVPSVIYLFPTPNGGLMTSVNVNSNQELVVPGGHMIFPSMFLVGGRLDPTGDKLASLQVLWKKTRRSESGTTRRSKKGVQKDDVEKTVDVDKLAGFLDVGSISTYSVYEGRDGWEITNASPIIFSEFGLDTEGFLVGGGVVAVTKALLPGLRADLEMLPNEFRIDFPIPVDAFSLGPVTITSLTMSLGLNDDGVFLRGNAGFAVASLGDGRVTAEISRGAPLLSGEFNLAMDFLDPARLAVRYNFADDTFLAEGTLGVQQGRIPGVESGQVTVRITRDEIGVNGTLSLGGPLRGTTINVAYDRAAGLRIGADNIQLPLSRIPAIQNATLSISGTRNAEGQWSFAGAGQATLAVPGATGTIDIAYLDGAITFAANAAVSRGPAAGILNFTATNREIDEEGRPVEGPPTGDIRVWGRGTVTIRFGNILTGTAGIELTPDNRVIISGTIALPPVFELFARREYHRDLFTLSPPEFPIWGVSVAGVGVGIFAFVDARVAFNAWVGPGQLRGAQIGATMDLERPEDATVTGHAAFHVPAYAGLSLDVGGGLRARIAVAFAEGRVGLTGELGIEASAGAGFDLAWNRDSGLEIEADLHAEARPRFRLSANASVTVGVDLLVTDVSHTFGPWTRVLGEFGPDMTLGVRMPLRWTEAGGLELSLDNIEVQRPSLDAPALMSSVFDQLAA